MHQNPSKKKLQVRNETLRLLTDKQMREVKGAGHTANTSVGDTSCSVASTHGVCGNHD